MPTQSNPPDTRSDNLLERSHGGLDASAAQVAGAVKNVAGKVAKVAEVTHAGAALGEKLARGGDESFEQWAKEEEKEHESKDEHIGFKKLEGELAHKKGVHNPAAVAAKIGMEKYGKKGMERKAHAKDDLVEGSEAYPLGEHQ